MDPRSSPTTRLFLQISGNVAGYDRLRQPFPTIAFLSPHPVRPSVPGCFFVRAKAPGPTRRNFFIAGRSPDRALPCAPARSVLGNIAGQSLVFCLQDSGLVGSRAVEPRTRSGPSSRQLCNRGIRSWRASVVLALSAIIAKTCARGDLFVLERVWLL